MIIEGSRLLKVSIGWSRLLQVIIGRSRPLKVIIGWSRPLIVIIESSRLQKRSSVYQHPWAWICHVIIGWWTLGCDHLIIKTLEYSIPDFNCRMTMTYLIMQGRPFKLGGTSLRAWRCLSKHFSNLGGKSWREVPPSLEGRPSKLEELIFLNKNLLFFWKRSSILWS